MLGRWRHAQTRDDHHYCRAEPGFGNYISTKQREHVWVGETLERLCLNEESIARADGNENGEECEFNKQKPAIRCLEKCVNRTDQQPTIGNSAYDENAHARQAERRKTTGYTGDRFV